MAALPTGREPARAEDYRELLSLYSNDIVMLFDDQFRLLDCNERAPQAYRLRARRLLALTLADLRAPDNPVSLEDRMAGVTERRNMVFESVHRRSDGTAFPVETSIRVVDTDHGSYYHTTVRDITGRQQAEQALRANRALLRSIVDSTTDAIYVKDRLGRYLLFNAGAERITGKRSADVLGKDDLYLFPSDEAAVVMNADRHAMRQSSPSTFEETVTDAAGRLSTFLSTKGPVIGEHGEVMGLFGIARDITERKQAEDDLRDGRAKLEAALASMTDAVFVSDVEGRFIEFNDAFATFHRFKSRAECATTLAEYTEFIDVFMADGRLAPLDLRAVPRALRGETVTNAQYTLRRKDTGETWIGSYDFAPYETGTARSSVPS